MSPLPPCLLQRNLQFQPCLLGTVPTIDVIGYTQPPFLEGAGEETVRFYSCAPGPSPIFITPPPPGRPKDSLTSDYACALDMPMKIDMADLTCASMSVGLDCCAL